MLKRLVFVSLFCVFSAAQAYEVIPQDDACTQGPGHVSEYQTLSCTQISPLEYPAGTGILWYCWSCNVSCLRPDGTTYTDYFLTGCDLKPL